MILLHRNHYKLLHCGTIGEIWTCGSVSTVRELKQGTHFRPKTSPFHSRTRETGARWRKNCTSGIKNKEGVGGRTTYGPETKMLLTLALLTARVVTGPVRDPWSPNVVHVELLIEYTATFEELPVGVKVPPATKRLRSDCKGNEK